MQTINTQRQIALIAGAGYLIIFITGIYANFFILEKMIDSTDAARTLANLTAQIPLFRIGILAFIIMVTFDIVLTWALYVLVKPAGERLALFMAWFRLVNCVMFGAALTHLFDVLEWVTGTPPGIAAEYVQTQVMHALSSFNYTWLIGLLFFGIHLVALGALTFRTGYIPRFIGILLIIAGAGYLTDSIAQFMLADYDSYKDIFTTVVVLPGIIGELSLTGWLLLRGGRQT